MTVAELIAHLAGVPADAPVLISFMERDAERVTYETAEFSVRQMRCRQGPAYSLGWEAADDGSQSLPEDVTAVVL